VVFDLNQGGAADEIDTVVKMLKEHKNSEFTFILISSVMAWAGTSPKEPREESHNTTEDEELTKEEKERKYCTDLLDEDFQLRMPSTRFAKLKIIENLVLQLPKFCPKIKVHVVCAGILYGNGERIFFEHFRKAWIGESVPLLSDGFNSLPTIHVIDLARLIKKIVFEPTNKPYILAVDHGQST